MGMEIAVKIIISIAAFGLISVFTALAFGAPIDKNKNEKLEEIKQYVIYLVTVGVSFYFIWTY